jgi:hypothetical protein
MAMLGGLRGRRFRTGLPRKRWPWGTLAVLVGLIAWFHTPIMGYARTGASFGAHITCSCRYIAGRSLEDCRKDFEKGMGLVMLSDNPTTKTVTARFPLLSAQTATYHDGQGCVAENWNS